MSCAPHGDKKIAKNVFGKTAYSKWSTDFLQILRILQHLLCCTELFSPLTVLWYSFPIVIGIM
jgi:hypothetical protein